MGRFDRYILSQLMMLFGFFSLILVMIYWVNQAVALFDQLISDGQSALVFLEFTALSLPNIVRLVMPISAFVASVYVTNRLAADSELVVVQSTGYSPYRLARPFLAFGVIVAALTTILAHLLVPLSTHQFEERSAEIAQDVTARMLTEGQFLNPSDGVTFYIREVTPEGELLDVLLSDTSNPDQHLIYSSARAYLVRSDRGPQLVMRDGMAQTLRGDGLNLAVTTFDDFAYDVSAAIEVDDNRNRSLRELMTLDLLNPTPDIMSETSRSAGALIAEGHNRITQALLAIVASLLGYAALITGGFSRFGVWKQILGAVILVIFINALETAGTGIVRSNPDAWPVAYLATGIGLLLILAMLWLAARPKRLRRSAAPIPADVSGVSS
ncbi:LPS export ABC transporter permease LptF [Aestuariibius sp. HNIBRBA575]|uniref:LPS export ABC transporter permease LptF n=1 Tax=Aestuariibius sp. HNIBRBA575 TaxID=3233343 RepID=UPI0034A48663